MWQLMTRQERVLFIVLTGAAVVGLGVRWVQVRQATPRVEVRGAGRAGLAPSSGPARHPVPINRADIEALTRVPGLGPVLAARIVAHREAFGPFATLDDVERVPGIGPVLLERIRGELTLE